jgi:transcriptional regulator with XRE-family HTH domain
MAYSLGKQLRTIRKEAGFSIRELSDRTRIPLNYVRGLEHEEFDRLPPPVYVKGFLQRWAHACGVGADGMLAQFYRENTFLFHTAPHHRLPKLKQPSLIISMRSVALGLAFGAILVLLGYFYYNQILSLNEPEVEVVTPAEFSSVTQSSTVVLEGRSKAVSEIVVGGEVVSVGDGGEFQIPLALADGLNTIVVHARGSNGDTVEVIRKVLKL